MIKRLRRKFILINMVFVAGILAAVLGILYYSNVRRHEVQSRMAMEQAMDRKSVSPPGRSGFADKKRRDFPPPPFPVFTVLLDEDGSIREIFKSGGELSLEEAENLVALADAQGTPEGVLKDYSVRYLKGGSGEEARIVFLDQSYEINVSRNLAGNCILIFFAVNILCLALSFCLSGWALKPARLAWEQQNRFTADASHELKTPLTVILANLGILSSHREKTIESQEKWLDSTIAEASRMKSLVEELLFLARSDAGAAGEAMCEFDFSDAVLNSVLLFESVAFEQKVALESDIAPGLFLTGVESRIRQLAAILLDNACKYAGAGGTVRVRASASPGRLTLTVSNTGEPIPPQDLKHIFDRFYRADKSRSRREGGYGLGLAIAQTIAHSHRGKISVASTREDGTVFTVTLPR